MHDIYLPHLRDKRVEVFVAGDGGPDWLHAMATQDPTSSSPGSSMTCARPLQPTRSW
jgi:hypothetical protein